MKIKIEQLMPLLKKGYVAMDEDGTWHWFCSEPKKHHIWWENDKLSCILSSPFPTNSAYTPFDIESVEDWEKSLMKCGE